MIQQPQHCVCRWQLPGPVGCALSGCWQLDGQCNLQVRPLLAAAHELQSAAVAARAACALSEQQRRTSALFHQRWRRDLQRCGCAAPISMWVVNSK
jgi:hypothetical protein